jgi:ABC-type transport system substrate-binding protein
MGGGPDYPDPQDFLSLLWTTTTPYNANLSHVSVPQADTLLAQADSMSDQAARIPLYQQAEQLLGKQGDDDPAHATCHQVRGAVARGRLGRRANGNDTAVCLTLGVYQALVPHA